MPDYRIFSMDGRGRILEGFNTTCTDDKEACRLLENTLKIGARAEIWSGKRFVAKVSMPSQPVVIVPPPRGSDG